MRHRVSRRTVAIVILLASEVAAMSSWFATNASIASIKAHYAFDPFHEALLTSGVQMGFVIGTLASAILTLPDRLDLRKMFSLSALVAALATSTIVLFPPTAPIVPILRFITGACMAGVYPVGMAIIGTWARADLGLLIGLLVGALTLGSAMPYLAASMAGLDWRVPCLVAGAAALLAAALIRLVALGPNKPRAPFFRLSSALQGYRSRPVRLANFGYFGHMWELYAMWSWIGVFLAASFAQRYGAAPPIDPRLATFVIVASGAVGALVGGWCADRIGRTLVTSLSMIVSGCCSVLIGLAFGCSAPTIMAIGVIWGVSVVADSAQFSAAVTELSDDSLRGTMLTLQTSIGFLLTLVSIHALPYAVEWVGWRYAFSFLSVGPLFGTLAILTLRRAPEAKYMARGNR
jgi:MFS family permease